MSHSSAPWRDAFAGHLELEETADGITPWRLPAPARRHAPVALALMAQFASGVRLRLRTDADRLELDASITRLAMRHLGYPVAPARFVMQDGGFESIVDVFETGVVAETPDRSFEWGAPVRSRVVLPLGAGAGSGSASGTGERDVVVWLPHDSAITVHDLRATRDGAPTTLRASSPTAGSRWLHHGSSISHGGTASGPTRTWPVLAAAALGVDVTNLGFGGNAMLDPMTARGIAGAAADVITLKLGINIVGADAMRRRTFVPALHGFLDLVREGHPQTPIVLITAVGCPALEAHPGPLRPGPDGRIEPIPRTVLPGDGTLTLEGSRALVEDVAAARASEDPHLSVLDGRALLGPHEGHLLEDGLHPGDLGYSVMAERFVTLARDPAGALGAAFAAASVGDPFSRPA